MRYECADYESVAIKPMPPLLVTPYRNRGIRQAVPRGADADSPISPSQYSPAFLPEDRRGEFRWRAFGKVSIIHVVQLRPSWGLCETRSNGKAT
ncbi:hypothetical protein ACVIWV_009988 [Bradyrhizobium diazoefficiens]